MSQFFFAGRDLFLLNLVLEQLISSKNLAR